MGSRYKWYVVAMLWWVALFNYADRQAIFSVFPLLERETRLSPVQLGLLGSSFAWVYGLCAPLAGNIVDRIRRKTAVLVGLQAWSVICVATAASRNLAQLLFFRAAEGLGETFYFPSAMSMISDYHGRSTRSRAMGFHQTSVYAGTITGGFCGGMIAQHFGWRMPFVIFGILGIVLGVVLQRFLHEPQRGAADLADLDATSRTAAMPRMPLRQFLKVIWGTPTVLFLMAAFMCDNFVVMVLFAWMPKFVYDKFHLGLAMAGLTATIFVQLACMLGSPVGGWLADTLRRRTPSGRIMVQALGVLGGAPLVACCGMTRSVSWLVVALTVWGFFIGIYDANIFASIFDVVRPEARGTAAGFMNMMGWMAGAGTAPVVTGYIAQRASLSLAISVTSVGYLAAGALLLIAIMVFVKSDVERMGRALRAETRVP